MEVYMEVKAMSCGSLGRRGEDGLVMGEPRGEVRDLSPLSGTSSALLLRLTAGLAATMLDWPAGSRTLP